MSGRPATDFKIPTTGRITRKRRAFIKKMEEEKRREEYRKKMKDELENEYLYLYIVLQEHLCRINLSKLLLLEEEDPPIETLLYFPDKELPVGIGAFAFNSNLYLLGGEVLKKGKRLEADHLMSNPRLCKRLSDRMFLYDHLHRRIRQVSSMTAPKPCPQVAVIDGKLYVIAGQQCCWGGKAPRPRFECYDPTRNLWDTLPEPPLYDDWPTFYLYVSVVGREIFVTSGAGLHSYHVDTRIWTSRPLADDSPFMFFGHLAESDDDGMVVAYTSRGLVAYKDATLERCQELKELHKALPSPCYDTQCSFVNYLGDKRYCLLLTDALVRVKGRWDMHILLFRVEMSQQEEAHSPEGEGQEQEDFCRVILLKHHIYDAYSDIMCHDFNPAHVFTMASSADGGSRGGEEVELPQLSKTMQELERIHSPARRPGGTLQMPILTSADYVPQSKEDPEMALQEVEVVPVGHVSVLDGKPLSKSARRNRKKKEKRLQLRKEIALQEVVPLGYVPVLESAKRNTEKKEKQGQIKHSKSEASSSAEDVGEAIEPVDVHELVTSLLKRLSISANLSAVGVPSSTEPWAPFDLSFVDKRLRAVKKEMRSLKRNSLLKEEQFSRLECLYMKLISVKIERLLLVSITEDEGVSGTRKFESCDDS
ncbi:hypothetical protein LguiA_027080 [Lonicera macranthoides]